MIVNTNENKLLPHDMRKIDHWHVDSKNKYGNEYAKIIRIGIRFGL